MVRPSEIRFPRIGELSPFHQLLDVHVRRIFVLAWLSLSVAQADPCDELGRAMDVLVPAVRGSIGFLGPGMRAD
jgi:hypothetical protein